jgi:hypothetical protein
MAITIQQLRTTNSANLPTALDPGQIAFNLPNRWMCVGNGSNGVTANGVAVSAGNKTVMGVGGVTIPAVATGKGYNIVQLDNNSTTAVISVSNTDVTAETGTPLQQIYLAAQKKTVPANSLKSGDQIIVTDGPNQGAYVSDGTKAVQLSSGIAKATVRAAGNTGGTLGGVYLANDSDVAETASTGQTSPDPSAVATGAQLKALADRVGALTTGTSNLGTYAATTGVATVNTTGTARGYAAGNKVSAAGKNPVAGDFFLITTAGTIAGETQASLNVAVGAGDHLAFDGSVWHVVSLGSGVAPLLTGLADVADKTVVTVGNQKGVLIRDGGVATDGDPSAYKLANVIDLGTF